MTVRDNKHGGQSRDKSRDETRDLDDLFYESVSLSEKLNRYISECSGLLRDEAFRAERDACREVLDRDIHEVTSEGNPKPKETSESDETSDAAPTTPPSATPHQITPDQEHVTEQDEEHVTEELNLPCSSESSLSDSELELSDELTEVSSTDSVSDHSDKDYIDLEIDDYNFKDCSITRKVNGGQSKRKEKFVKKPTTLNEKTKRYVNEVEKKVSCKCCRSVMGRIVHEVRQNENAINIANLKPYKPKTTVISNVKEAIDFQIQYEREWYSAILIQRAWRSYYDAKVRRFRRYEDVRQRNEMRLKYGHIAGFVKKRDARKRRENSYQY